MTHVGRKCEPASDPWQRKIQNSPLVKKKNLSYACALKTLSHKHTRRNSKQDQMFLLGSWTPICVRKKESNSNFPFINPLLSKKKMAGKSWWQFVFNTQDVLQLYVFLYLSIHPLTSCGSFNRGTLNFNRGFLYIVKKKWYNSWDCESQIQLTDCGIPYSCIF